MNSELPSAFEKEIIRMPLEQILPRRSVSDTIRKSVRYQRIFSSMREVGLIEPIIVFPLNDGGSRYTLIDGHLRCAAARELGMSHLKCIISADDEGYTYNKRVSHLATVQEHLMILRALKNGVSEERLARSLNVDVKRIRRKASLLDRICPQASELLKEKEVNTGVFDALRKMSPLRQIEAAELMNISATWTSSYARALLVATRQGELAKPEKPKNVRGISSEQMARMEIEMSSLQTDFKRIEASYGDDILQLVVSAGFVSKLLTNAAISDYLESHYPELVKDLRSIVESSALDGRFEHSEETAISAEVQN